MSMKKILAMLLTLVMVLALAACGGKEPAKDDNKEQTTTVTTTADEGGEKTPEVEAPETDEPVEDQPSVDEPGDDEPVEGGPVERPMPQAPQALESVIKFVDESGEDMIATFEEFILEEGMTCNSTIEAMGSGFVITICLNELNDVPEDVMAEMQASCDELVAFLTESLADAQAEIEGLTYYCINYCDVDGDMLASMYIGE